MSPLWGSTHFLVRCYNNVTPTGLYPHLAVQSYNNIAPMGLNRIFWFVAIIMSSLRGFTRI